MNTVPAPELLPGFRLLDGAGGAPGEDLRHQAAVAAVEVLDHRDRRLKIGGKPREQLAERIEAARRRRAGHHVEGPAAERGRPAPRVSPEITAGFSIRGVARATDAAGRRRSAPDAPRQLRRRSNGRTAQRASRTRGPRDRKAEAPRNRRAGPSRTSAASRARAEGSTVPRGSCSRAARPSLLDERPARSGRRDATGQSAGALMRDPPVRSN